MSKYLKYLDNYSKHRDPYVDRVKKLEAIVNYVKTLPNPAPKLQELLSDLERTERRWS